MSPCPCQVTCRNLCSFFLVVLWAPGLKHRGQNTEGGSWHFVSGSSSEWAACIPLYGICLGWAQEAGNPVWQWLLGHRTIRVEVVFLQQVAHPLTVTSRWPPLLSWSAQTNRYLIMFSYFLLWQSHTLIKLCLTVGIVMVKNN